VDIRNEIAVKWLLAKAAEAFASVEGGARVDWTRTSEGVPGIRATMFGQKDGMVVRIAGRGAEWRVLAESGSVSLDDLQVARGMDPEEAAAEVVWAALHEVVTRYKGVMTAARREVLALEEADRA